LSASCAHFKSKGLLRLSRVRDPHLSLPFSVLMKPWVSVECKHCSVLLPRLLRKARVDDNEAASKFAAISRAKIKDEGDIKLAANRRRRRFPSRPASSVPSSATLLLRTANFNSFFFKLCWINTINLEHCICFFVRQYENLIESSNYQLTATRYFTQIWNSGVSKVWKRTTGSFKLSKFLIFSNLHLWILRILDLCFFFYSEL